MRGVEVGVWAVVSSFGIILSQEPWLLIIADSMAYPFGRQFFPTLYGQRRRRSYYNGFAPCLSRSLLLGTSFA